MGMFDSFFFENGVLLDNKVSTEIEFQTKSLSCDLDKYYVSKDGDVKRFDYSGEEICAPINDTVEVYSYEFLYDNEEDIFKRKFLGSKYQEYKIVILNSKIVFVEKLVEDGYEKS